MHGKYTMINYTKTRRRTIIIPNAMSCSTKLKNGMIAKANSATMTTIDNSVNLTSTEKIAQTQHYKYGHILS